MTLIVKIIRGLKRQGEVVPSVSWEFELRAASNVNSELQKWVTEVMVDLSEEFEKRVNAELNLNVVEAETGK